VFATPWRKIVSSCESLAESHQILAQKIETDIERPLREFSSTSRDMQAMATISGNLASMAKDIDASQRKADKLKLKGEKAAAGKVASATSEVENAQSQWDSQAPYVFEKLQDVDESRCDRLRDLLTQFQTHEVDQVERNRVSAEDCLNAILNIETADEIKTWAAKAVSGKPKLERPPLPKPPSSSGGGLAPPPPSTPSRRGDDDASQRSGSSEKCFE
jgi:F-BAR domain only protein